MRRARCEHKFGIRAIYDQSLPFDVTRLYDEARKMETRRAWTAERNRDSQAALHGRRYVFGMGGTTRMLV